jgi:hypothetical protein
MWQQWQRDHRLLADRRQDWRSAVEFVNRQADSSHGVCYVRGGFVEAERLRAAREPMLDEYCLAPVNNIYKLRVQAIPIAFPRDITLDPDWLRADARIEKWFIINSRAETRQQFISSMEQQARQLRVQTPFVALETFGDLLVGRLNVQPTSPSSMTSP